MVVGSGHVLGRKQLSKAAASASVLVLGPQILAEGVVDIWVHSLYEHRGGLGLRTGGGSRTWPLKLLVHGRKGNLATCFLVKQGCV